VASSQRGATAATSHQFRTTLASFFTNGSIASTGTCA
jgi:hypothetical protein